MSNIAPLVDSNNVTLEWPRPEGRVETYIVRWWESTNPGHVNMKNISMNNNGSGPVRLLVGDLMPGVEYVFEIQAFSNDLESDITTLHTRTSKYNKISSTVLSITKFSFNRTWCDIVRLFIVQCRFWCNQKTWLLREKTSQTTQHFDVFSLVQLGINKQHTYIVTLSLFPLITQQFA